MRAPANTSAKASKTKSSRDGKLIGVISDTHGLLRPQALNALRGSDLIVHAGDVGDESILITLRQIAPVTAVRGNVDREAWARALPATEVIEVGGVTLCVVHILAELDMKPEAAGFRVVVYGHSHLPEHKEQNGVLYFNPGSAGPRRFQLPITLGRLRIKDGEVRPEIIPLLD